MNRRKPNNPIRESPIYNRLPSILLHTTRYAFGGVARLAEDAGVSASAISRLMSGDRRPSYFLITRIVAAIEADLGIVIDPREIFREDPYFPSTVCKATGCPGCTPPFAYGDDDELLPEYAGLSPGEWEAPVLPTSKSHPSLTHHP